MKLTPTRKKALGIFLIGNLLPICYVFWMCFSAPAAIVISPETTFLTEPLTPDGQYVDYVAYYKQLLGEQRPKDDLWKALVSPMRPNDESSDWAINQVPCVSYQDPRDAIHPTEESWKARSLERERYLARCQAPFSSAEDPEYAEITEANETWYQAVLNTEPGPVGLWWDTAPYMGLPITDIHQQLHPRFQLRTSLAFGNGDFRKAIESYRFILKVAARERTVPFWETQGAGVRIAGEGTDSVCSGILNASRVPEEVLRELDKILPPDFSADKWTHAIGMIRLQYLEDLQETHRSRATSGEYTMYADKFGRPAGNWFVNRVDFRAAMKAVGQTFNDQACAFRIADYQDSITAMKQANAAALAKWPGTAATTIQSDPTVVELATANHTGMICRTIAVGLLRVRARPAQLQNNYRRLRLTIRLHVYRTNNGHWPDSLHEVLNLPGWETEPSELITDAFTRKPFNYRRIDDGFLLYSIGPNLVDDTKGEMPDSPDGWRLGVGDDELWPWPHPRYQIGSPSNEPSTP